MSSRNMAVSVLVKLVDGLTAPLRGMMRSITSIGSGIANVGRQIGMIGGALAAISFMAPIQQAAALDTQLRDIAITAGKTGLAAETMIGDLSKQYQKLAFLTGQTSDDVVKGAKTLIAGNMAPDLIEKMLPTVAKVATATGATITDTAKTVLSLSDTLKIPADQMEAMLGKLAVAGKLGRFEFVDMARALPELTAQMAKLSVTGLEAVESLGASLQIAMIGTADPSQAATNLNNFLTKINAPEAIKKFEKELKVDITGVMTDATAKGINPIEAVIGKMISKLKPHQTEIDKIMKKAGVSDKQREEQIKTLLAGTKVGKLFADMQVLGFILPMMQNIEKYKEFREQLKTAGVGTIVDDFATRMKGLQPRLNQFGVLASAVGNRIGLAFASNLPTAMTAIQDLLKWVDAIDKRWPGLVDGVLSWTGVLLAAGVAIALLTPVISALAAVVGLLFSPIVLIGAAIAGLAYAAYYVWRNWDTIAPKLLAIWNGLVQPFRNAWESMEQAAGNAWDGIKNLGNDISKAYSAVWQALKNDASSAWEGMKTSAGDAWNSAIAKGGEFLTWIKNLPGRITESVSTLANDLMKAGAAAIQGLWDGMAQKFDALIAFVKNKIGELTSAIKLPSLLGGGAAAPGAESGVKTAPSPSVDPMGNPLGGGFNPASSTGGSIGGSNGFTRQAAANSNVSVGGRIVVEATEGLRVTNVESTNPAVPMTPNRGAMLARA